MLGNCKVGKKILLLVLVVSMVASSLVSSRTVYADSGDRINTFINLASGKQTSATDLNNVSLTEEDLRFLGVYISNFFVPFGTELGNSSSDDVNTVNKEDIKKALQTNLNFNDALADSLTETLLGLSRANVKELVLCVSDKYQTSLKPVSTSDANIPLNSYTALACMLGGLEEIISWYDEPNDVMEGIEDGTYKYGYFAYQSGSKYVPVFDFHIKQQELTPSSAAFIKCMESVDIEMGYGFNFFDFTKTEMGISEGSYGEKADNYTDAQIYAMSTYGTKLGVDCFGNIIYMGGNHQFIAVPGCMNPYTWVTVDSNGDDVGKGLGGTHYNMINIPSMSLYNNETNSETDNTLFQGKVKQVDGEVRGSIETKILVTKLKKTQWKDEEGTYELRKVRGSKDTKINTPIGNLFGSSNTSELAKKAENGFREANKNAYNFYNANDKKLLSGESQGIRDDWIEYTTTIDTYGVKLSEAETEFCSGRTVSVLDSFVYVDTLGAYHFDDSNVLVDDFTAFPIDSYTKDSETAKKVKDSIKSWGNSSDNGFTNTYKTIENGRMVIPENSVSDEALVGIYITYAFASLYDEYSQVSRESTIGKLGYRLNFDYLPDIPEEPLMLSDGAVGDIMEEEIRNWIYYILHPTEGLEYVKVWLSNMINSFLLGWHSDMVGTNGTGSINGTTKYRGFTGYVTTPELSDIPWTSSLLNMYNSSIPYLLIVMVLLMLIAYVVGTLTFQKAIIGLVIFAISVSLPPVAINGIVGTSNRFSSELYGEKFTYWALVQHETYSSAIDEAVSENSYSNYLKTLYETNSISSGNQGSESIMIKWQAPKKMSSLMLTNSDESNLGITSSLVSGLLNSTYSGETYTDNADSVYLYRSYIDISNFSRYIHRGLKNGKEQPISQSLTNEDMKNWSESLKENTKNFSTSYEQDRSAGYTNVNGDGSTSGDKDSIIRVKLPMASKLVNEQLGNLGTISEMTLDDYVGINQDAFQFSIPMFNVGDDELVFKEELKTDNFNTSSYTNEDFSSLAAYGLMSENVFYYFSWYLYETGLTEETYANTGYKNLLLGEDNAGFFYNTRGNGEMKDFMDMKSLFTYIIPYLNECNQLVYEWDDTYGIYIHEGVPTEEGHQNDTDIKGNKELEQKYWHNLNVARLYNMYTPWVDVMYDCSYADSEKISYLGEEYVISDPINPASYPEERPMIFSRSEMHDYGLSENNLTKVERLILECQDDMQERMFKLLNYHTFNDVVLNTASAMNCAFAFNTTFSENSLFGANNNIYPQSFELNNFSYDAFLRFILSNSTGDSMVVGEGEDFYSNVTENSSMTTILVMLILDILAMYVIPGFKMFFIVGIFIMAILLILVTAFRVDSEQKFVKKFMGSFLKPLLKFLFVTCGMSLIVSWFMGEGNTSITGSMETSISLGDPVMAMLIMIVLNCFVVYLYFKILWDLLKDIKKTGAVVASFIGGVVGSLGKTISRKLSKSSKGGSSSSESSNSGGSGSSKEGGSSSSQRAKNRGTSHVVVDKERRAENMPRSEGGRHRRSLFSRDSTKGKDNTRSSQDISDKIDSGMDRINNDSNENQEQLKNC